MLRKAALGTLAVYWIAIFVGTHVPHGVRGLGKVYDKLLHFGAYAGLAFLLAAALTALRRRRSGLLLPFVIAAAYGCVDELSQMAVRGRRAEVGDWLADLLGAGVGVVAFGLLSFAVARYYSRPATPPRKAVTESAA